MSGPVHIDPRRLEIMDSHSFTLVCNELLRAEAGRIGLPQMEVDVTVRDTAPDAGIDARITPAAPPRPSNWLPAGPSVWQYKSGSCPSVSELREGEFTKPGVRRAVTKGSAYVFVTADSIGDKKKQALRAELRLLYEALKQKPNYRVYCADDLAAWAGEHLPVAAGRFGVPLPGWQTVEQWETAFPNPYVPDSVRTAIIGQVREAILAGTRYVRIVGLSGLGKSRLTLEAVRLPGTRERTLYLDDAHRLDPMFFHYLNKHPGAGVLVIDECTADENERILALAQQLPATYTVVAVGPAPRGAPGQHLELSPLGAAELAQIAKDLSPGLPDEEARAVAKRCGGSPKLLVYVAQEIAKGTAEVHSWAELEQALNVVEFLNRKVFPIDGAAPAARLMRGLSLFTRVGWEEDASAEGKLVADYCRLEWYEARDAAQDLIRRGVVSRRGRGLYPSPDILANYLTLETLKARGLDGLRPLLDRLQEPMRKSFAERLALVGDDPATQQVTKYLFGDVGFFDLAALADEHRCQLLRMLASAFPAEVLARLDSAIGAATREQLLELEGSCRREVVWALEALAWWESSFQRAARLLLRLASAENEQYGNNATGVWNALFQVFLGSTEAGFEDRMRVLRDAVADPDPTVRRLGIAGLSTALKTHHFARFGAPPLSPRRSAKEWKPDSSEELRGILAECVALLGARLQDADSDVRRDAAVALSARARGLVGNGLLDEWLKAADGLKSSSFELRRDALRDIDLTLKYVQDLTPEDRARLSQFRSGLIGSDFSERLKAAVAFWRWERNEAEQSPPEWDALASEAAANPEMLASVLDWLLGGTANAAWEFGSELASADQKRALLPLLAAASCGVGRDDRLVAGYLARIRETEGPDVVDAQLDAWAKESPYASLAARVTWRIGDGTSRSAQRLIGLMKHGAIPGSFVSNLALGFWAKNLSPGDLAALVEASEHDPSPAAVMGRLAVVEQYVDHHSTSLGPLGTVILQVLRDAVALKWQTMDAYHWTKLASNALPPLTALRLALEGALVLHQKHELAPHELTSFIEETLPKLTVDERWELFTGWIGPNLVSSPGLAWQLDSPLEGRTLLALFQAKDVADWVAEDVGARLSPVAHAAPVSGAELPELARELLVRWGDREEVQSALAATFGTGSWWGRMSEHLQAQLNQLERWSDDPQPRVHSWAQRLAVGYRESLRRARLEEEEEGRN